MTRMDNFETYEEYCRDMQRLVDYDKRLKDNLDQFRREHRQQIRESGKHFINYRHKEYDQKLAEIALENCKSKKEWQDMEADYNSVPDWLVTTQISAQESLERYIDKINRSYAVEIWYEQEITKCEQAINKINNDNNVTEKSRNNKITHWQKRKVNYLIKLHVQITKTNKLEALVMKWRGVCEKIRISDIAKEIKAEKLGVGNKYGFNPNMHDRTSATDMFDED